MSDKKTPDYLMDYLIERACARQPITIGGVEYVPAPKPPTLREKVCDALLDAGAYGELTSGATAALYVIADDIEQMVRRDLTPGAINPTAQKILTRLRGTS